MTELVLLAFFPLLMAYAASSDLLTMTIPNTLSLLLVVGFGLMACLSGLPAEAVLMHLVASGLVFLVTFVMFALGWMGGGDAKLAAATALWLGFGTLPDYLLLASIAGGGLTLAILAMRTVPLPGFAVGWTWLVRLHDEKTGIPYGIALAAAALLVYPHSELWAAALAR